MDSSDCGNERRINLDSDFVNDSKTAQKAMQADSSYFLFMARSFSSDSIQNTKKSIMTASEKAATMDGRSYRLMMAHAIRHYDRPVMGLLAGSRSADGAITIRACFPIIHSYPTKMLLNLALELVIPSLHIFHSFS
jgi:hypothetical protein